MLRRHPVLPHDDEQRSEAADGIVERLDSLIDRVGVTAEEKAAVDQPLEGQRAGVGTGRQQMHQPRRGVMQVAAVQVALGLVHQIGDIDDATDADALTRRCQPLPMLAIKIGVDHAADLVRRRMPGHQRQEALFRREFECRVATRAGDADRDVRERLRNDVPALALPELPLPVEGLRRAPRFADQFDRFAHHGARITGNRSSLIVPGDVHADTEPGHVAALRKVVADRRLSRYLQWMEERQGPDSRSHPNRFREGRRLADQQVCTRQLIGRLMIEEGAVLADPGLGHPKAVGGDDLI